MKIQKILKRLLQLHPKSVDLSLDRIKRLLKDLDNPEKKITNAIQVVGTNGKYSFCSTLREIFETAGYTVNMNISPSLRKFNERYYLTGKYISDDQLHDLLIEVEKINHDQNITFHEFICACFFLAAASFSGYIEWHRKQVPGEIVPIPPSSYALPCLTGSLLCAVGSSLNVQNV